MLNLRKISLLRVAPCMRGLRLRVLIGCLFVLWVMVHAGAVLLGGAVHGGDVRGVRAAGSAAPDHGSGDDNADRAALACPRHRDHRHI
jgi:hypothetical protein